MDNLQAMFDVLKSQRKKERSETQMTLGSLIEKLKVLPPATEIEGLGDLDSYRGYYDDLAFAPTKNYEQAGSILERCQEAIGQVFYGFKGGEFVMGTKTALWLANYGSCGVKLMAINDDGSIETAQADEP